MIGLSCVSSLAAESYTHENSLIYNSTIVIKCLQHILSHQPVCMGFQDPVQRIINMWVRARAVRGPSELFIRCRKIVKQSTLQQ